MVSFFKVEFNNFQRAVQQPIINILTGALKFAIKGKQDLLKHAKNNNSPEDAMGALNLFKEKTYDNVTYISKEVGRIE